MRIRFPSVECSTEPVHVAGAAAEEDRADPRIGVDRPRGRLRRGWLSRCAGWWRRAWCPAASRVTSGPLHDVSNVASRPASTASPSIMRIDVRSCLTTLASAISLRAVIDCRHSASCRCVRLPAKPVAHVPIGDTGRALRSAEGGRTDGPRSRPGRRATTSPSTRHLRAGVSGAAVVDVRRPRAGDDPRPSKASPTPVTRSGWPRHLKESLDTELVASFAIDELLDYRSRRPLMTFKTDHFTHYDDPELSLYALHDSVGTPFLLLAGMEPDLQWERFVTAVGCWPSAWGTPDHRPGHHPDGGAAHPADHDDRARQRQGVDRRPSAVGRRGSGPGQRVKPPGIPDGPARTRGRRLHRARAALPGADRLSRGRTGAARRWPRPGRCSYRSRHWPKRQPSAGQDRRTGRGERRGGSSGGGAGAPVRCLRCRSGKPVLLARDEDLPSGDELGAEFERFLAQQADKKSEDDDSG